MIMNIKGTSPLRTSFDLQVEERKKLSHTEWKILYKDSV